MKNDDYYDKCDDSRREDAERRARKNAARKNAASSVPTDGDVTIKFPAKRVGRTVPIRTLNRILKSLEPPSGPSEDQYQGIERASIRGTLSAIRGAVKLELKKEGHMNYAKATASVVKNLA